MDSTVTQTIRTKLSRRVENLVRRLGTEGYPEYQTEDGIVRFVRGVLRADPAPYQEEILRSVVRHGRAAIRGPHGLGKTALAAWVVIWAVVVFPDVKAVTTASAWRQLTKFLWPEIRKWAGRANWKLLGLEIRWGKELLSLSLKMGQREAFAAASNNPDLIEGAHAETVVYVFDEAKAIPDDTWDAAEGAFSGAGADTGRRAFALAISTPGPPSGRFYDIHSRKAGTHSWWTRHVTLPEAIAAGRISQTWVDQMGQLWGTTSSEYMNRVLGEFDETGSNNLIPLRWVQLAIQRWRLWQGIGQGSVSYGLDVAREGDDKTALAKLVGRCLERIAYFEKKSTMWTVGRVAMEAGKTDQIAVDVIGMGSGVTDRLQELGYATWGINVQWKTDVTDRHGNLQFVNLRSAIWWMIRDMLDPENPFALGIPDDEILIADLVAPKWGFASTGRIVVESKKEIKKRLKRSPDGADAFGLAILAALGPMEIVEKVWDESIRVEV